MTYSEKLKDPRWQKKRLEVLNRDGFKCSYCDDEKTTLHVHHLKYNKNPWDVEIESLSTLCEDCHGLVEALKKSDRWLGDYIQKIAKIKNEWNISFMVFLIADDVYKFSFNPKTAEYSEHGCFLFEDIKSSYATLIELENG